MSSIYFISAADEIIEQVIKDFTPPSVRLVSKRKGPAYKEAHLFFTGAVQQSVFEKMAASPAAPHIRAFVETYLNFIAFESRAYHLGTDNSQFGLVFKETPAGIGVSPSLKIFQQMADQIVGACVTMNEIPQLRYQKNSFQGHALKLASLVQESFDAYCSRNPNFKPMRDGQLVILDRTIDMLAPLLHEFTFQAMANDLLCITDGSKYSYKYSSGEGGESSREVTLDENDTMWVALRHSHIAQVSQTIVSKFNEFMNENKAARTGKETGGVQNLAQLKETMNDLAEFHEMKAIYSLHLSIAQECIAASDKKKLIDVAKVEQNMATGLDAEGEKIENVWADMAPLLARPNLSASDKARLVMIYLLTQPQLSDSDRKSTFDHAKLGGDLLAAVRQIALLSQNVSGCGQRQPFMQGRKGRRKTLLDDEYTFEVSRYIGAVKVILDDAANNELDDQEFPLLKASSGSTSQQTSPKMPAAPVSLRARTSASSGSTQPGSSTKGSISAFIIGGSTYSELRSAYELAQRNNRDFYIGSDRILTPELFLTLLK